MYISHMANTENTNNTGTNAVDAEVAGQIRSALEDAGMSVNALAAHAAMSQKTLDRSLKGGRSFTLQEFYRIAAVLALKPSLLLPAELTEAA